jgi:hypothetical protein
LWGLGGASGRDKAVIQISANYDIGNALSALKQGFVSGHDRV